VGVGSSEARTRIGAPQFDLTPQPCSVEVRGRVSPGPGRPEGSEVDLKTAGAGDREAVDIYRQDPSTMDLTSKGDDDFPSSVSGLDIADSLRCLAQRVCAVDDRSDLSGLDELFENNQVVVVQLRKERTEPLAHER
jgi:hypothetical protein